MNTANTHTPAHQLREQVIRQLQTLCQQPPAAVFPAPEVPQIEGLHNLYYEGLPAAGRPTRVFAYYGIPAHASAQNKVPAIVLVHGGSGTAYADWVKLWTDRGYAVLAMDHDGGVPIGDTGNWQAAVQGGPRFEGVSQVNKPIDGQWLYHAVADTILANTLLRSFPEVDATRVGVAGISWGGVITAITTGIDHRFCFASSVYGCGCISGQSDDGSSFVGKDADPALRERWSQLWDPARYLPASRTPTQWINGTNDFAFTLGSLAQTLQVSTAPAIVSLRHNMPHGHGGAGESPIEIRAFADSITGNEPPLPTITAHSTTADTLATAAYTLPANTTTESIRLFWTTDTCQWQERQWQSKEVATSPHTQSVSAQLANNTSCFFFNLTDSRGLSVSSAPQSRAPAIPKA